MGFFKCRQLRSPVRLAAPPCASVCCCCCCASPWLTKRLPVVDKKGSEDKKGSGQHRDFTFATSSISLCRYMGIFPLHTGSISLCSPPNRLQSIAAPAEQREARNSPSCGRTYLSIDSEGLEPAARSYTHDARPARECVPDGGTIGVPMF